MKLERNDTTTNNREPLLLSPEQVATELSIGRTKVYDLICTGQLPSLKIGRSRRVPLTALRRFIEESIQRSPEVHQKAGHDD